MSRCVAVSVLVALAALAPSPAMAGPRPGSDVDHVARAHPVLRNRLACVARVRESLPPEGRTNKAIARRALAVCVPSDPWVRIFTGDPPRTARRPGSTYVDRSRLVVVDRSLVRFWVLVEHFDQNDDFYLAEWTLDCSTGATQPIQQAAVRAGEPVELAPADPERRNARESYQGQAVIRHVCAEIWETRALA
jgi:hypothetical protein